MQTVYYLVHGHSRQRLKYYKTRAGARIAQRNRNDRLGFHTRLERVEIGSLEYERCLHHGEVVDATWIIEEDYLESPDLLQDC